MSYLSSKPQYYLMDAGYDHKAIYEIVRKDYKAQAIIPLNHRGAKEPPEGLDWDATPICSAGYRMVYWGGSKGVNKFRCPHIMGKCDCPFGSSWCSDSNYGMVIKTRARQDPRLFCTPHRGTTNWQSLYNKRTCVERSASSSPQDSCAPSGNYPYPTSGNARTRYPVAGTGDGCASRFRS
nr:hypothetical protein [Syntrophomonas palmitatica]